MRRRVIEVDLAGYGSVVRGWGSRDLVESVTGRVPMYARRARGWSVQEKTACDVIAAAEAAGFDVVVTGSRASRAAVQHEDQVQTRLDVDDPDIKSAVVQTNWTTHPTVVEQPDPGQGLW